MRIFELMDRLPNVRAFGGKTLENLKGGMFFYLFVLNNFSIDKKVLIFVKYTINL